MKFLNLVISILSINILVAQMNPFSANKVLFKSSSYEEMVCLFLKGFGSCIEIIDKPRCRQ